MATPNEYREDEYEVVPLTPLRRLEERIRKIEQERGGADREFILDVMDLVKSNQKLVDEVVKANNALRTDLQAIPNKIDELLDVWRQFIELLKRAAGEEALPAGLGEKFDRLIALNEQVLESTKKLHEALASTRRPHAVPPAPGMPPGTSKYPRIRIVR